MTPNPPPRGARSTRYSISYSYTLRRVTSHTIPLLHPSMILLFLQNLNGIASHCIEQLWSFISFHYSTTYNAFQSFPCGRRTWCFYRQPIDPLCLSHHYAMCLWLNTYMHDNRSVTRGMSMESIALQRQGIALDSMSRPRNPSMPRHQLGALRLQDTCHGDFLAHCHQGVRSYFQQKYLDFYVVAADILFICRAWCTWKLSVFVAIVFSSSVLRSLLHRHWHLCPCLDRILWRCSQRARGGQGAYRASDPMVTCSDTSRYSRIGTEVGVR